MVPSEGAPVGTRDGASLGVSDEIPNEMVGEGVVLVPSVIQLTDDVGTRDGMSLGADDTNEGALVGASVSAIRLLMIVSRRVGD